MRYFHVMNRQLAHRVSSSSGLVPRWSQMYASSMIGGREGVHGLVISATVAIYNQSANPINPADLDANLAAYKSLLGVGGTDVPVSYLRRFIRPHELGPNGYAFLMTKTGFVTIHPELKLFNDGTTEIRKTYRSMSINQLENLIDRYSLI